MNTGKGLGVENADPPKAWHFFARWLYIRDVLDTKGHKEWVVDKGTYYDPPIRYNLKFGLVMPITYVSPLSIWLVSPLL